jgi:CBS domain containing-hemolysin-like protein
VTLLLVVAVVGLALLLGLTTFVQLLYLESMRLRARELPALEFFRDTLEDRIGLKGDRGTLAFSLIKHSSMLLLGLAMFGIAAERAPSFWLALLEASLFAWATMLVAAYIVPQLIYRKVGSRWLLPLLPLVRGMCLAVLPLTSLLAFLQSLTELNEPAGGENPEPSPEENIEALITAGAEEGLIEEEDRKLIHSVVTFGDKTVREIMTARPNIVAIAENRSLEDLRELVINEQFSRVPVYRESIDNIVGFVHVRDIFELEETERAQKTIRDLMRPIPIVPESKAVADLLREMQEEGTHMVVVVNEYGDTAGLATLEDLVEEVFGEIRDEHEPEHDVAPDPDGGFVAAGSLDLDHLRDLVDFRPSEEPESTTVGGLVSEWMGRVPKTGETIEREGIRIEVLAANELRVDRVRIQKAEEPEDG